MAATHVQTKDAQTGGATSLAINLTLVGAGNHLVATAQLGRASGLTSAHPTIATSSPTATWPNAIAGAANTAGSMAWRTDYSENVASGSWTVTVHSGISCEITGIVSESSGVATTSSIGVTNGANINASAGTTIAPGSITPTVGSILYCTEGDDGGTSTAGTIDNSFVVSSDATAWNGANQRAGIAHKDNVAANAINPTWTIPSISNRHSSIIEFLAAGGGGGGAVELDHILLMGVT